MFISLLFHHSHKAGKCVKTLKSQTQPSRLGKQFVGTNKMRLTLKTLEGSLRSSQWPNWQQLDRQNKSEY